MYNNTTATSLGYAPEFNNFSTVGSGGTGGHGDSIAHEVFEQTGSGSVFGNRVRKQGNQREDYGSMRRGTYAQKRGHVQPYRTSNNGNVNNQQHRQQQQGYHTQNYNRMGNNVHAGTSYSVLTGGALTQPGQQAKPEMPKRAKPFTKYVVNSSTCIRVFYMNGEVVIRLSDCVDVEELRLPFDDKKRVSVSAGDDSTMISARTVFLSVDNFKKLLSIMPQLNSTFYQAEEKTFSLGTDLNSSADLDKIHTLLYKYDGNPSVSACRGNLTFRSYYYASGPNQEDVWRNVYGEVTISGPDLANFEQVLPDVQSQLSQMPPGGHLIAHMILNVIAETMLSLLHGQGSFKASDISIDNSTFLRAYFICHQEMLSAGYAGNVVKKMAMKLEEANLVSPIDLFSTFFQFAGMQVVLIERMSKMIK
jgi:hypothetical protein